MTLQPTREEWLAARERMEDAFPQAGNPILDKCTEAALGPCPPEPAPRRKMEVNLFDGVPQTLIVEASGSKVAIGAEGHARLFMTPSSADQMARWLNYCAQWLRENRGQS